MPSNSEVSLSPNEVRARFRWAKRQGRPAWLWPDVSVPAWREAVRNIEIVLRAGLAGRSDPPLLDGDPVAIGLACYTSGTGPLLGHWHAQARLSVGAGVAAVLELHLHHNRLRAARMEAAAISLVEVLAERGIAVAVLKGAHTGPAYFGAAGIRPGSDIDLLVQGEDMARAEALIRAAGYAGAGRKRRESSWRLAGAAEQPRSLTMVHGDDPWTIDLHGSLNISAGAGAPVARLDDGGPMSCSGRWALQAAAITLDQPLLLLHLAVHAGAGMHNLTLLRLVELALVIRRDSEAGRLRWEEFVALGEKTDALGYAFPALHLCEALAPGTVPGPVIRQCADRAPAAVRRLLRGLTPAMAQRIDRSSIAEHFMWCGGWAGRLRQAASDIIPAASWRDIGAIYERRAWALMRGRIGP